jgi:hypothetical protein
MFGLQREDITVLRFIGNRNITYCLILTVSTDYRQWQRVKTALLATESKVLLEKIRDFIHAPLISIIYDPKVEDKFSIFAGSDFSEVNGVGLSKAITDIDRQITDNVGTIKEINASINDTFQVWTRKYLSKYVTINDFDAFSLEKRIIYELKRIKGNINDWRPYLDDHANYATLLQITKKANRAALMVVAYERNKPELVALHKIMNADKESIKGRFIVCRPEDILNNPIGIPYQSKNRRQFQL